MEVRDIPTPEEPPPGHVLVDMDASTITHGDKFFLTRPLPGAAAFASGGNDVYGSNGGGTVVAIGAGVPEDYAGRQVAIYKTLTRSQDTIGVWCGRAQVPYANCLILPDSVHGRDYCGSFANILTVYAFLSEAAAAGHKAVIVTAGSSATGRIAVSLTRRRNVEAIFLVRSTASRDDLIRHGAKHVVVTANEGFESDLGALAEELGATAVFDGVGGGLLSRIVPVLPMNATVSIYGFLGGPTPISFPTMLVMGKNLTLRRFSNLETATVRDPQSLAAARKDIEGLIDDPLFRTRIGKEFSFEQIDDAMAYEATPGARALLIPSL
ncbi:MAG: zinc-binding dehydrogenase [Xanthobacteraceae bacterium]|nr:zinc-binding dehydrogenase [Xanthobacteraceae bacterium]